MIGDESGGRVRLDGAAPDQAPGIPALDDARVRPEIDRGRLFIDALREVGLSIAGQCVIDLGAGYGSISIAAAQAGASKVLALDANPSRLHDARLRASALDVRISTIEANFLDDPPPETSGIADVVLLVGVLEYAGLWKGGAPVQQLQTQVMEFAMTCLRPGGVLVMATKNRLWPVYALRDVHTGLPLVNALPRSAADAFSLRLAGHPYRHHIHTPGRWTAMLRSVGFRDIETLFPYLSYQYPLRLVERPRLRDPYTLRKMPWNGFREVGGRLWAGKVLLMATARIFGVRLSPSLLLTARK